MKNKLKLSWGIFLGTLALFVCGVEILHKTRNKQHYSYQCRIVIDKDLAANETSSETEREEKPQLYEKTAYGIIPRKQTDYMKIFNAYASDIKYEGDHVKVAVVLESASLESVQKIIDICGDTKITFIIPHYAKGIENIANSIIMNGCEFFIQLPTQTSIPQNLKDKVAPFLANASPQDNIDKLNYLISSAQYAIGIANISESLVTKSRKDMELLMRELSQRGMAFLCASENDNVLNEIRSIVQFVNLQADIFSSDSVIQNGKAFLVKDSQFEDFLKALPQNVKCVPISFGIKNASI
ncbi:MAG: hypothetical protein E7015_03215 [Alphaproteobacteria bacterium]|nr:hypothetical protein [Alphaproteobacteria bacterium]